MNEPISRCCGAPPMGETEMGMCSDCQDHCEFTDASPDVDPELMAKAEEEICEAVNRAVRTGDRLTPAELLPDIENVLAATLPGFIRGSTRMLILDNGSIQTDFLLNKPKN